MSLLSLPQIVFEAVTSGQRGLLAIKDVVVQGHQCSKSFFFFFPSPVKEYHQTLIVLSVTPDQIPVLLLCSRPPRQTKGPSSQDYASQSKE